MIRWYVAKKDVKKNIITAAPEGHPILYRKDIKIKDMHLIGIKKSEMPKRVLVRIRQVGELMPGTFKNNKVILDKEVTGISDGQAIVLYTKTKCLGGGVISF